MGKKSKVFIGIVVVIFMYSYFISPIVANYKQMDDSCWKHPGFINRVTYEIMLSRHELSNIQKEATRAQCFFDQHLSK